MDIVPVITLGIVVCILIGIVLGMRIQEFANRSRELGLDKETNMLLVFKDWERKGKSIYNTREGLDLAMGDLHSGTFWRIQADMDREDVRKLDKADAIFILKTEHKT